ncbi:MAG: PstS family phosphate ABC transporter substrate-binding protein [Bacteroidetes bacterium]|nr:PstS family phosphate ABC transporter substrate-binding protein [Bacteroidota bacterium]
MKKSIGIISILMIAFVAMILIPTGCKQQPQKDTISISGAFALYPLTVKWAEEYQKIHPEVRIDVSAGGAGKGMTDVLSGMVDLAMFSRSVSPEETSKGAWSVSVSRDAVLPMINAANPHLALLKERGIKQSEFVDIFINKKFTTWNQLLGNKGNEKLNVFTRSDACGAAEMWGKYLGKNQESIEGVGVFGDPGMADAVKKDALGLGYNNVIYAYDIKSRKTYPGLDVLPIDINSNGKIDPEENFYSSLDSVMSAIRDRRYPSPPARDLFLISKGKPEKKSVTAFLEWILTDGQKYVNDAGYVQLKPEQIETEKSKLK